MSEQYAGFIIDIKRPTNNRYAACLVVTPKSKDGYTDKDAKVERNLGHNKCIQIAYELLKACNASDDLLGKVHSLAPNLNHPITA